MEANVKFLPDSANFSWLVSAVRLDMTTRTEVWLTSISSLYSSKPLNESRFITGCATAKKKKWNTAQWARLPFSCGLIANLLFGSAPVRAAYLFPLHRSHCTGPWPVLAQTRATWLNVGLVAALPAALERLTQTISSAEFWFASLIPVCSHFIWIW